MRSLALAALPAFILAVSAAQGAQASIRGTDGAYDAAARRATRALNLLEAKGYGDFRDFHAQGRTYIATVTQQGHPVTVTVDPDSSQVTLEG